jgi:hypothetical protein
MNGQEQQAACKQDETHPGTPGDRPARSAATQPASDGPNSHHAHLKDAMRGQARSRAASISSASHQLELFSNGGHRIPNLVNGGLQFFPRYVELVGPAFDLEGSMHFDLGSSRLLPPGEAVHASLLSFTEPDSQAALRLATIP